MARFSGTLVEDEAKKPRFGGVLVEQPVQAPTGAAPALPEAEPADPSLLRRTLDRVQGGVSDAMSTLAGDTYGRYGDPTARDELSGPQRLLKAAGGDVIPAFGDAAWDATVTAGKAVLPQAAEDAIAEGVGQAVQSATESDTGQKLMALKQRLDEQYPGEMATAGELFNVGTALMPKVKPSLKHLRGAADRAKDAARRKRLKETTRVLRPDQKQARGSFSEEGILQSKTYQPSPGEQRYIEAAMDVEGFNPRSSYTSNIKAVEAKVDDLRAKLDTSLDGAPPLAKEDVLNALDDAKDAAYATPTLAGEAGAKAEKIFQKLSGILNDKVDDAGNISPKALLDARRELDTWLHDSVGDVFNPDTAGATQTATREMRRALNALVHEAVPDADVAGSLRLQADLLNARDVMMPRAWGEGGNRLSRGLAQLEATTGVRHPTTPQSIIITAQNPMAQVAAAAAVPGMLLARYGPPAARNISARAQNNMAAAIRAAAGGGQFGAWQQLTDEEGY